MSLNFSRHLTSFSVSFIDFLAFFLYNWIYNQHLQKVIKPLSQFRLRGSPLFILVLNQTAGFLKQQHKQVRVTRMHTMSHDIDHDIPFNLTQNCHCGNLSFFKPIACFLHAHSHHDQFSRNIWLGLLVTFLVCLAWGLFL